ncbi:hypothetical protein CVT26_005377 [Gymnopilus dilepis]|uniref:Uncharacterized protein n=1 Tax=Gymnopilus dilepis TaxID=231916 RepID=A0A409WWQ3_9AGAR|nr:hypothetical protein CVT26_005377 [Gymnopilus dilepis]
MAKYFVSVFLAALAFTMVSAAPRPQSSGKSDPSFLKRGNDASSLLLRHDFHSRSFPSESLDVMARVDTIILRPREGVLDANKRVDAQFLKPSATAAP